MAQKKAYCNLRSEFAGYGVWYSSAVLSELASLTEHWIQLGCEFRVAFCN